MLPMFAICSSSHFFLTDIFFRGAVLPGHINWYNRKRIKLSLAGLSPMEYRQLLGFTVVSRIFRKLVCRLCCIMKSASNGGVLNGSLQVLHIHVLLVAPLGAGHMAQPGTDQHEGRVAIREATYHTGAAADLPVQPFKDIVGADTGPVLTGKIAVGQRFFNAVLHLLGGLLQSHGMEFLHHRFSLLSGRFLALLGVDCLKHLGYQLHLGARRDREYIAVKVDGTPLILGFREHFSHSLQHTKTFVTNHQFNPIQHPGHGHAATGRS